MSSSDQWRTAEERSPIVRVSCSAEIRESIQGRVPSKSEHRAFRLKAEEDLADGFEMRLTALILLDDRMDIADPPLEGVAFEDRRRAGRMVGRVHDFACLVDRPGRGQPDRRVVIEGKPPRLVDVP